MHPLAGTVCLKIDVDTHDGTRTGVPSLLEALARHGVSATFFLTFGPDNSGKAIWNVFRQRGFLRKMWRTGAPKLYGWRTILSGTLLPARPTATAFPELVRRIVDEGHEVGVHAWDHRRWQDHLPRMPRSEIADAFARADAAFREVVGADPTASAAPAWLMTRVSLEEQDRRGLVYASDTRSGPPGFVELDGYRASTLQIPTTQPCLEELLTQGHAAEPRALARRLLEAPAPNGPMVLPLHAEVEGGPFASVLTAVLEEIAARGWQCRPLGHVAAELLANPAALPTTRVAPQPWPGRAGQVIAPAPPVAAGAG